MQRRAVLRVDGEELRQAAEIASAQQLAETDVSHGHVARRWPSAGPVNAEPRRDRHAWATTYAAIHAKLADVPTPAWSAGSRHSLLSVGRFRL